MPFIYWEQKIEPILENYTLILPAIAVGNVGQLATDLLLANLKVKNIAYLHHPCFLPFTGADAFDPKNKKLSTSCQMYECEEKKLVIIQHRSPLVKGRVDEYIQFLIKFIKEKKIKNTVMLSSSFAQFFTYDQLQSVPIHYLCSGVFSEEQTIQNLLWKKFNLSLPHISAIPGGGISKLFFDTCEKENIPLILLILVCSEGDNYNEAFQMVVNLNRWLKIREGNPETVKWSKPFSWSYPFANDAPHVIY